MKRTVESAYWLGDIVYQRVAVDESPLMITCIQIGAHRGLLLRVRADECVHP